MSSVQALRVWSRFFGERRFAILLSSLIILMLGTPIAITLGFSADWLDSLISLPLLAAILSVCFEPRERVVALLFGIPSMLVIIAGNSPASLPGRSALIAGRICQVLFLFGAAMIIVRHLFQTRQFTFDNVFGAICGYMFLGLAWTGIYVMIEEIRPGSFQINQTVIPVDAPNRTLPMALLYYSFMTLTTVGYGDILPMIPVTRTLASLEAIAGQFYLAVIVAALVNTMSANKSNPS